MLFPEHIQFCLKNTSITHDKKNYFQKYAFNRAYCIIRLVMSYILYKKNNVGGETITHVGIKKVIVSYHSYVALW